jgi:23S rRNA (uridine2552-2'-O)-methyltransferase
LYCSLDLEVWVLSGEYVRKDHLYQQAKQEGYRSRAAYKLLELDKKYRLFRSGMKVLDLGSFPGGWLQVALEKVGAKGTVIGVDLREVEPVSIKGNSAVFLLGDVFTPGIRSKILKTAGGKVDVLLSDLSPHLTGIRFRDAVKSAQLVEYALMLGMELLKDGGTLVTKIFPGAECEELAGQFRQVFKSFARPVLKSSRKSSTELYFVGRDFVAQDRG